ncbi:MAG: hypothetical protein DRN08_06410 [Thermoplasmata archaeon]|nr:MAG: hypothetical protein DRN08_06410 [Thermoplasmata archaeon]
MKISKIIKIEKKEHWIVNFTSLPLTISEFSQKIEKIIKKVLVRARWKARGKRRKISLILIGTLPKWAFFIIKRVLKFYSHYINVINGLKII